MDDRAANLGPDELPGPANMCWHWEAPRVLCVLKLDHEGDHVYANFNVTNLPTDTKEKE